MKPEIRNSGGCNYFTKIHEIMKGMKFVVFTFLSLYLLIFASSIAWKSDDQTIFGKFDDFSKNQSNDIEFDKRLESFVMKSPVNEETGRHQIILFVTNEGVINFARNAICSLSHVIDADYKYVAVALDEVSYVSLKKFGANVIYYASNFTHETVNYRHKVDFYNIVKIREHIAYKILKMGADVIISDVDIVYLQDPVQLFTSKCDFEVQCDSKVATSIPYDKNNVFWSVNLGFYKMAPTDAIIKFVPIWEYQMEHMPESHDQTTLWMLLRGKLVQLEEGNILIADIKKLIGAKSRVPLSIKYIDPLLAVNAGGVFLDGKEEWKLKAAQRRIKKPVICHFFHLSENTHKEQLMKSKNLWYLDKQGNCMVKPPKGHSWPWWN